MIRIQAALFLMIPFIQAPVSEMGFPGVNWEERTPESQGLDSVKLNQALSWLASQCGEHKTDQVVVTCNGYMVWKGNDIDNKHNVWSCSKSFTSTVLGLLIDEQKCELHTKACDYVPTLKMHYPDVSLEHFTTMTSGYNAVGGAQSSSPYEPDLPLHTPGTMYKYHDCALNQMGNVLTRIAAEPLEKLFQRKIADPIGMDSSCWDWFDWGIIDGVLVNGGAGNKSKGISISAREMARFGHLFLNRGNWDGKQLLSSAWVDMATRTQVEPFLPAFDSIDNGGPGTYGFNWWVNGIGTDGVRKWPSAPPDTYAAIGHNNNVCFVLPEWKMVIVRLGVDGNIPDSKWDLFLKMVSEALD
jgi:CubicO group peptidase (beta-lactamase class C family)